MNRSHAHGWMAAPDPRAMRRAFTLAPPQIDFDAVFAAWAFLTGLFPLFIGSLTGVSFVLLPISFCLVRPERLVPLFKRVWPVLLFPGFTMVSSIWSVLPGTTLYYSTQFALTVLVATMIGAGLTRRQALNGIFAAFLFQGLLVFAVGMHTGSLRHAPEDSAGFVGFAGSKNTTADMACMGLMVAIARMSMALRERRPLAGLMASGLAMVEAYIVYCATSAGADAAVAVAGVVLLALLISARLPPPARFSALTGVILAAFAAAVTEQYWYRALFERYLSASGKDETLTGRTYIWSRAEVLYHQHPLLGRGFGSFWRVGDLESEAIWERMFVANRMGFNFHSSIYELLVYLGVTGLVLFFVIAGVAGLTLLVRVAARVHPVTCLYCAFLVYDGMRLKFEAVPLGVFSHNVLLLYAAFAAAFAAPGKPEGRRQGGWPVDPGPMSYPLG